MVAFLVGAYAVLTLADALPEVLLTVVAASMALPLAVDKISRANSFQCKDTVSMVEIAGTAMSSIHRPVRRFEISLW